MSSRKEFYKNCMRPLSNKKLVKYDFVGFDVETFGKNNTFLMGGLYFYDLNNKPVYISFWNKKDMIDYIVNNSYFKGKYIVATNLTFDFTVLFYGTDVWNSFHLVNRNSDIILAIKKYHNSNKKGSLKFIDTFNFLPYSVNKLGKIIGYDKLDKPSFLGEKICFKDFVKRKELEEYNKRDCEISAEFMYFLQKGINKAGGKIKTTIASCSIDVWRRNFLNKIVVKENYTLKEDVKPFIFNAYYGGRTECFKKGLFNNVYYYDVNSLYPSVMLNKYPDPNSVKKVFTPTFNNIINYEGVSECFVCCPKDLNKPFLPYRSKTGKLLFPTGEFKGFYNHNELRKAVSLGYKVRPVKQIIYTKSWFPFKDFVEYCYSERLKYQENNSNFQLVFKLLMNSLYGKFAMKSVNKFKIIDVSKMSYTNYMKEIKNKDFEFKKDDVNKVMIKQKFNFNGVYSFPILSSYTSSYARIKMYDFLKCNSVIYTDTDSVLSLENLNIHSKDLGKMKLEGIYSDVFIVKPKFYYYKLNDEYNVKIKGLSRATISDFNNILSGGSIEKMKFSKLKESFRSGFNVNEIIFIKKHFSLKDDKRNWFKVNNATDFKNKKFDSTPLNVSEGGLI